MNAKSKDERLEDLCEFIELYQSLTEWQQLKLNTKMFGYLVGHFVKDCKGRSLEENAAELRTTAQFFTGLIWPTIRQPLALLALAAIAGVLWGFTMYRLGL